MPRVGAQGRQVWGAGSSSGDEDTPGKGAEGNQASEQVFERYLNELGGDNARDDPMFVRGVGKVRQYLASAEADSSACLICLGTIKPTEAVWSCRASCYVVLHMTCMQEWARSQIDTCVLKTMNRLSQFPGAAAEARATAEWGCPKCRQPYPASAIPRTYTCFCGKVEDPEWDPWRTAHSCGDLCGRALASEGGEGTCDHTCLLLCHPGPCPPCPLVMDATCYCGARHDRRRCGHHEFSCGGECCARLPCGHVCRNPCHPGECMPCDMQVKSQCQCGAETRLLPCSERDFQCGRVCGKALSCGNHVCERTCHAGPCGACPSEGARTCPCGHVTYTGLSCMEKAPTCGGTCGKMLPCGQHTCQDRCHSGECSSCRATVTKACRCGKSQKAVPCAQELLCDRRCNATRACGRHPCKRRCCAGGDACPPCEEVCGRKLRCGNHRCPAPCHPGPCRPCPLTVGFSCACGRVTATLPCGAEARAVPPRCPAPCAVPSLCRHAPAPTHRCHYGPCPPCTNACGTLLGCGHPCGSPACHDPPPPAVPAFIPPTAPKVHLSASSMLEHLGNGFGGDTRTAASARAGMNRTSASGQSADGQGTSRAAEPPPAAAAAVAQAQLELGRLGGKLPSSCPPCVVPVEVSCFGSHEQTREACCLAKAYQCKRPCGQRLACGNHLCQLPCHVTAASASVSGGAPTPCQACTQACGRPRACGHACDQPCHATPCPPCTLSVRTPCHCGKASLSLPCVALCVARAATASNSHATASSGDALCCGKPCHRPLPNCPHPCRAPCHAGACPGATRCEEEVTVRCACKRLRAKWPCHQVASALQEAGRPSAYDATTTLRLLPCDAECATAAVGSQAKPRGSSTAAAAGPESALQSKNNGPAKGLPANGVAAAGGSGAPVVAKPKLTRAEREAEAARREQERALQAARARRWSQIKTALVWAVIVLLGLLLGVGVPRMMGD